MVFLHVLKESLKLPSKKAHFKLNQLGMDIAVIYISLLLILVSLPAFMEQLISPIDSLKHLNMVFLAIYFFIFHYLPLNIIVFSLLSLLAFLCKGLTIFLKRKLHYSLLWKMCAFSSTIPFLLYPITSMYFSMNYIHFFIAFIFVCLLVIKMIFIYPKI